MTNYAYDDAASRLTTMQQGASGTTYTYDDNGNLANEDSVGVNDMNSYDRENRLISQERNEITFLSYTYDGDGLRRTKTDPNLDPSVTTFVWDGSDYLSEYAD